MINSWGISYEIALNRTDDANISSGNGLVLSGHNELNPVVLIFYTTITIYLHIQSFPSMRWSYVIEIFPPGRQGHVHPS